MNSRDFVLWMDGFLEGKSQINIDDIRHIQNKIGEVVLNEDKSIIIRREGPPTQPIIIQEPDTNKEGLDFPGKPPNVYM